MEKRRENPYKEQLILGEVRGGKQTAHDGAGDIVGFVLHIGEGENRYISKEQAAAIGEFRNMRIRGGKLEYTENGASRVPRFNGLGQQVTGGKPFIYIKERVEREGELLGYVVVDVQGKETEVREEKMRELWGRVEVINASVLKGGVIRGIKKPLRVKEYRQVLEQTEEKALKNETKKEQIEELSKLLNKASDVYYNQAREIMSNREYDKLYDKLSRWERETGYQPKDSPTRRVGYVVQSELAKKEHSRPILSLDKTKDVVELGEFLGDKEAFISWKLDGITVVATYVDGVLREAVTRGNGVIGELITENYRVFQNIPRRIGVKGVVEVRGEGLISYKTFERINSTIPEESKYKNPRNLASGSIRQLNTEETAKRGVRFVAFDVVDGLEGRTHTEKLEQLAGMGFEVVEYTKVRGAKELERVVEEYKKEVEGYKYPTDGLVYKLDDIAEGESLGETGRVPRNAIAFKWEDGVEETVIREIEWSNSRTGAINPVAIFDPVELEGTTVTRASLHNISILEEMEIGIGDVVTVYKANMIIPQVEENLTRSGPVEVPGSCGVCGGVTEVRETEQTSAQKERGERPTKILYCTNKDCRSKKVMRMVHFSCRGGMYIEGLSESTISRLLEAGVIEELADIYKIKEKRSEVVNLEGMGERSFERLVANIEKSRRVELPRFLRSLGIEHLGNRNSEIISSAYEDEIEEILSVSKEELVRLDGIGEKMAESIVSAFNDPVVLREISDLLEEITILKREFNEPAGGRRLEGKTIVVTGKLNNYKNRKELEEEIKNQGGKTTGSVTGNTDYLVTNNPNSTSSKNKKAKELGTPIISEQELDEMMGR